MLCMNTAIRPALSEPRLRTLAIDDTLTALREMWSGSTTSEVLYPGQGYGERAAWAQMQINAIETALESALNTALEASQCGNCSRPREQRIGIHPAHRGQCGITGCVCQDTVRVGKPLIPDSRKKGA